jgi:hypothetical protein
MTVPLNLGLVEAPESGVLEEAVWPLEDGLGQMRRNSNTGWNPARSGRFKLSGCYGPTRELAVF